MLVNAIAFPSCECFLQEAKTMPWEALQAIRQSFVIPTVKKEVPKVEIIEKIMV